MFPKIKFSTNKALDKEMLFDFLGAGSRAGSNFTKAIIEFHPGMKNLTAKSDVGKYVDKYYIENGPKIESARKEIKENWVKIEDDFFKITARYFEGLSWPEGKYIGYISINPIGPRFISSCTWQTPYYWVTQASGQIMHELLHFIFYKQMDRVKTAKKLTKDQRWHLSEIFNDIILREPELIDIQGYKPEICYPDHKKVHRKYLAIWNEKKCVKDFIVNSVAEIKKDY